ncbi:MAG: 4Fe-4S dicluster domain-containing protein [Desulfovibrionaceae bacterium]
MSEAARATWSPPEDECGLVLSRLKDEVSACMQCGTCTASCPNGAAMDITPRAMWRMIQFGMVDAIFESRTYWMCSACYTCTLRCPRGLKLTSAMASLKRLAMLRGKGRRDGAFYRAFMENVAAHGRVREVGMMGGWFLKRLDNPGLALGYLPLGLRMLGRGKVHLPFGGPGGVLEPLFAKAREMEEAS